MRSAAIGRILACAFALAVLIAPAAPTASAGARQPDSLLVRFKVSVPRLLPGDKLLGTTATGVAVVKVRRGQTLAAAIRRYRALPTVKYAEVNGIARADLAAPNDPSFGSQWGAQKIDLLDGWSVFPGSYGAGGAATIAIVDSGIDSNHPDLSDGRVVTALGANCSTSTGTCSPGPALDDYGHGTHVAGIAAAATNNSTGVAGTAFGATLVPVKVLDSTGYGTYAAITNGISWAYQHGAKVINLSLNGSSPSQTVCDAVSRALAAGTVVVVAAGNNNSSAPVYPAACAGTIGVAATDSGDGKASFSNYGSPDVFVSAPGVSIYSTTPGGSYQNMSGTSMAAPFVTGLVSMLLGQDSTRTVADVKTILAKTSDKVGSGYAADPYGTCPGCTWSSSFGYGRINAYSALSSAGFNLSGTPASATVTPGSSVDYQINVGSSPGFSGAVALSVSGLPIGATASFSPTVVTAPGTSQLTVSTLPIALQGSYQLTVTGRSGATTRSTTVELVVRSLVGGLVPPVNVPVAAGGDFSFTASPSSYIVARPGLPAAFTLTFAAQRTYAGPIDLTVSGLPANAVAAFAPATTAAPGASVLTILTTPLTPSGVYGLVVTATNGSNSHTAGVTLNVK